MHVRTNIDPNIAPTTIPDNPSRAGIVSRVFKAITAFNMSHESIP